MLGPATVQLEASGGLTLRVGAKLSLKLASTSSPLER